ncbi:MAG: lecithin retinol acyltransferase family protein [Candidatus Coproplasma sp.]
MNWQMIQPESGDMIRVKIGNIYHYGVYVSDGEVIQFGLAPSARLSVKDCDVEVCASDVDGFLQGGFLETAVLDKRELKARIPREITVRKARSRIGEKGYNMLYNNCEHFAYECVMGEKKCTQADAVRAMFHNLPIVDVYTAKIPDGLKMKKLSCKQRWQEIEGCTNERVQREKYCAWKLLEYALFHTFGLSAKKTDFAKEENGRWVTDGCSFSLSHCGEIVAVCVSRRAVGVDVERITDRLESIRHKFLTRSEEEKYAAQADKAVYLAEKWTQKESIFKMQGGRAFSPDSIETEEFTTRSMRLNADGGYILSVASMDLKLLRIHQNVDCEF